MPTETAAVLRHVLDRMRARDPEYDALRRALRAAVVVPIAAAVSFAVGGGSQTPLFTIFGSVALLIMVDFPGNRPARALAYCGLGVNGAVLITLGTLVAPYPWVSVALMFVLGVVVIFAGVLSEIVAAGQRATLLMFVLPACTPVGPLPERLLGWLIALAICVPAALFLFPPRHHDELRAHAARVCNRLADRLEGNATGREVTKAMNALDATFLGADYRPVALTAGSRALVRVVDDLGWLSDRITDDTGRLLGAMKDPAVRVLRDSAAVLRLRDAAQRAARGADLHDALTEMRTVAQARYREDITETARRIQRRGGGGGGPQAVDPPHDRGHHRGNRQDHPQRCGGGRPAGVGACVGPSVAGHGGRGLGDARNRRGRRHHQGLPRHQGGRAAQQLADGARAGARGRRHPCVSG